MFYNLAPEFFFEYVTQCPAYGWVAGRPINRLRFFKFKENKITKENFVQNFCLILFFTSHQESFSYGGTGLPGFNHY